MKPPAMNLEVFRTSPLMQKVACMVLVLAGIEQVAGFEGQNEQLEDNSRIIDQLEKPRIGPVKVIIDQLRQSQFKLGFRLKG